VGSQADLMATGVIPKLGPEANRPGFSLHERLRGKQVALKTALLDQKTLAGVGNIYADEALWRARLKPSQLAATVGKVAAARLQQALVEVLNEAISNRGSSIEGYRDAWGQKGRQQESLAVYGRGGEPCLRCGRTLHQKQIGGRSSVFCVHCQV
jgi:formamidopyrimidine-DNA glycosylase